MATIADTIRASLAEGKTNEQVLADVKAAHPTANTSAACVSYYRSKMKKAGTATAKPEPKAIAKAVAAVSGNPSYTVKGVKSFIGNEGHGFNATLYRDGKAVAFVYDDASGGPVAFEWKDRDGGLVEVETRTHDGRPWTVKMTREERAYHTFVSAMPKQSFEGMELDVTMDIHVSGLVNDALLLKDVAAHDQGQGGLHQGRRQALHRQVRADREEHRCHQGQARWLRRVERHGRPRRARRHARPRINAID